MTGGYARILFRLTDPDIPDRILENGKDKSLRLAARKNGEIPAISAHLVLKTHKKFDASSAYPATLENVDYLSKSLVTQLLNLILSDIFTEERELDDGGKIATFSPRVEFRGHQSQTIRSVLNAGGKLHGVKFVTNQTTEDEFGDPAYAVSKSQEVNLSIKGGPTGVLALDYFKRKVDEFRGNGLDTARIVIEDRSGRTKTSKVDVRKADIAANFFISQEHMTGFATPLAVCEPELRDDVVAKMIGALPLK